MEEAFHRICRYEIEFHDVLANLSGIRTLDKNPRTWTHVQTNFSFEAPVEGQREPYSADALRYASSDRGVTTIGDLPNLEVYETNGTSIRGLGATVVVTEVQKGLSYDTGGIVAVEVTQNGMDFTDSGVTYEYLPIAEVDSLEPNHGPVYGGTEIIVRGSSFRNSSLLSCRFGDHSRDATVPVARYFNSSAILCVAPPSVYAGEVYVEVSNNGPGANAIFTSTRSIYTYETRVVITGIDPPLGPTSGNFSVRVTGGPFIDTPELRCKFGDITVLAKYVATDELVCYAPPHRGGRFTLEITNNDQDYSDQGMTVFFYSDPALSRIMPVSGPSVTAGTQVTVFGDGFVNTSLLMCRFGNTIAPGIYVDDRQLICPAPPYNVDDNGPMRATALSEQYNRYQDPIHSDLISTRLTNKRRVFPGAHYYPTYISRLVEVDISNNGQDWTDSGITFLYQKDAITKKVTPFEGLDTTGTPLFVQGENFVNYTTLRCRLGPRVVNATFLSTELVMCFAPAQVTMEMDQGFLSHGRLATPDFGHSPQVRYIPFDETADYTKAGTGGEPSPGTVTTTTLFVEVANNGVDFTSDRVYYDIGGACPTGSFCPGIDRSAIMVCPRGTFSRVLATETSRCVPGVCTSLFRARATAFGVP
jgi:hypothetical protein